MSIRVLLPKQGVLEIVGHQKNVLKAAIEAGNRLDEIYQDHHESADFARQYLSYISSLVQSLDHHAIGKFIDWIMEARENSKSIFFMGNGGSAATASHFANDLAIGTRCNKPIKAQSITDNMAVITAIANDWSFDDIFVKQLEVLLQPNDFVVAISASGNSKNIIKAIEFAKARKARTIGLCGFDGGQLIQLVDLPILVKTRKGEYGPVEDLHIVIDHLMGAYLSRALNETHSEKSLGAKISSDRVAGNSQLSG